MKIVCDSCGAKYSIADEKVAGKIFKIRCKKCSSVLEVRGDQTGAHPFADPGGSQDTSGAEPVWYVVVDGEQKGPLRAIELSQLFAKGAVGLDTYVWREGFDDWKVAGDVTELKQIFGGPGAAREAAAAESADDTSAFSTGGDLFTGGRGEPSGEADTHGSMFGGFDEAPTPTDGKSVPATAGAPQDSAGAAAGASAALGGLGGGIASAPQKMTGQRNENSVLFSLSNLQQLATRGTGASPAAASPESAPVSVSEPQASGEGSGLIDIRALARSTTPGTRQAQSQAVDDLLAIGAGGGGTLGAPLLGPAPLETRDGNRWLWIGGIAVAVIAIVGAGIGVGMALGGSDDDALEIAPPVAREGAPQSPQTAEATAEVAVPTPAEAPAENEIVDIEPEEEPVAAATLEEPPENDRAEQESTRRQRSSSSSQRRRTSSSTRSKPDRDPQPARKGNNLDALMDEVVGGSTSQPKQTRAAAPSTSSDLPDSPSRDDVKRALLGVGGAVKACGKDGGGTATVDVTFSGKTGRATGARVSSGPFKGTPVGACVESAVKRARVPRFKQSTFKVTFPYRL